MSSIGTPKRSSKSYTPTSRTAVPAIISKFESQAQAQASSSSTRRPTSLPLIPTNPFPSPPLSASPYEVEVQSDDPWQESLTRGKEMELDGVSTGMEGSWRLESELHRLPHGREKEREVIWDVPSTRKVLQEDENLGGDDRPESSRIRRDVPMNITIWADVMDTSKGRDKVLKCAQYSMRTYLYLISLIAAIRPLSPWFKANSIRTKQAVSGLSLTRKCLLLLNPLRPLTHILSPKPTSAPSLIQHLIDLFSAMSDDIYCLSRLGILNRRAGRIADRWANRFWLLTTLINLYILHLKTLPTLRSSLALLPSEGAERPWTNASSLPRKIRNEAIEAEWTGRKLLADLIFVSYEVFNLSLLKEPVQCISGLAAAFISTNKMYDKQFASSLGKG